MKSFYFFLCVSKSRCGNGLRRKSFFSAPLGITLRSDIWDSGLINHHDKILQIFPL